MVYAPTADQILDLDGVRCRVDDFRFELLDSDEQIIGNLSPSLERPPTLTNDTTASVPRTMSSLNLTAAEVVDINPLSDRLRPVMVLQNSVEYTLGVFVWSNDSQPEMAWGLERASTLSDKMVLLNQGTSKTIGWGKGADVGLAALSLALSVLPEDQIHFDSIDAELGVGVNYPLGTAQRSILAEFAKLIAFLPPWINRDGILQYVGTPDVTTADPTLTYEAAGRIIDGSIARSNDQLDAPNVFRVYENSGQSQIVGEYRLPASAPNSVENRGGREICDPQAVAGLKTLAQANAAAKALAVSQNSAYRWLSFDSTLDPRHDTWDLVTVLGEVWLETKWSMTLRSGGLMNHVVRQVL